VRLVGRQPGELLFPRQLRKPAVVLAQHAKEQVNGAVTRFYDTVRLSTSS
jgi:hypothetical protein